MLPDDVRLPRVYIAFRAPAYGERAWYAADLLAAVLAGGKSSPLYRDLVYDRQIAQDVGASVGPSGERRAPSCWSPPPGPASPPRPWRRRSSSTSPRPPPRRPPRPTSSGPATAC